MEDVINIIRSLGKVEETVLILPNSHFSSDLGLDSIDKIELMMHIEDTLKISVPDNKMDTINCAEDIIQLFLTNNE